jgi:hypothetical protein
MHENREEKNDRQRNADKPEQHAFSKTHISLRMMEFYAPTGRRFQPGNCGTQKVLEPTIGFLPLRVFKLEIDIIRTLRF